MKILGIIWRVVDTLLGIAIRADELAERRRARRKFDELVKAKQKDDKLARSRAPTIRLPADDDAPPTEPTRPARGR